MECHIENVMEKLIFLKMILLVIMMRGILIIEIYWRNFRSKKKK